MKLITDTTQIHELPSGSVILENLPAGDAEAWRKGEDGNWWSGTLGTADGRKIHLPATVIQWGEAA